MENYDLSVEQLLPKVIEVLNQNLDQEYCSIIWLQRQLKIGFYKSCILIEMLEKLGYLQHCSHKILKRN